jgi:hypothetical protein
MAEHSHNSPVLSFIYTIISWVTLTITFQKIDIALRLIGSIIAIVSGILAGINWYWSIRKNKKMAKRDIPF